MSNTAPGDTQDDKQQYNKPTYYNKEYSPEDNEYKSSTWPVLVIRYMAKQSFTNVLLTAILGCGGWLTYYTVTILVPSHLTMIQAGYERIQSMDAQEREKDRAQAERWIDRLERKNGFAKGQ